MENNQLSLGNSSYLLIIGKFQGNDGIVSVLSTTKIIINSKERTIPYLHI